MFSYYGSKSKIVDCYPKPKYGKIIEPFAGSARYSLKWFDRDVLLVDKYDVIIKTWHYLQRATEKDILGLPKMEHGDSIRNYPQLSEDEKNLLSFLVCAGSSGGRMNVGSMLGIDVEGDLKRIAKNLFKIKHWEIRQASYESIDNQEATWFIDPPYQFGGHEYKHNNKNINFPELSEWCRERQGQVIVCENTKATWMEFKPIKQMQGTKFKTTEAIWSNQRTAFDNEQSNLFATVALQNVK